MKKLDKQMNKLNISRNKSNRPPSLRLRIENGRDLSVNQHDARKFILMMDDETPQDLLVLLASENGKMRIRQIIEGFLNFGSVEAGSRKDKFSFQRVLIPLLKVITKSDVRNSMRREFKIVISLIHGPTVDEDDSPQVESRMIQLLEELCEKNTVIDYTFTPNPNFANEWYPKKFDDILLPICEYLYEISSQFPKEFSHSFYYKTVKSVIYRANEISTLESKKSRKIVSDLLRELNRLSIEKGKEVDAIQQHQLFCRIQSHRGDNESGIINNDYQVPEGRHDNDFVDYREIKINLTMNELNSEATSYLPKNISDAWHHLEDPELKLLDTHFRLYREDLNRPIYDAVRSEVDENHTLRISKISIRRAKEERNTKDPIMFDTYFKHATSEMTFKKRKDFWENHERFLAIGSVVCVKLDEFLIFMTVYDRSSDRLSGKDGEHVIDESIITLSTAIMESGSSKANRELLRNISILENCPVMVVVPSHYISHTPVLKSLQNHDGLPFNGTLSKRQNADNSIEPVEPGAPIDSDGWYDVTPLLFNKKPRLYINIQNDDDWKKVENNTTLDPGQLHALRKALQRNVALIQGPPGTGKSFVGVKLIEVLLYTFRRKSQLQRRARLPFEENDKINPVILCMTYTNHALDQLLEDLLPSTNNIVRLGSRSNSEKVQPYTLQSISRLRRQEEKKSKTRQQNLEFTFYEKLDRLHEKIVSEANLIDENIFDWDSVKDYIYDDFPGLYDYLEEINLKEAIEHAEGWKKSKSRGKNVNDIFLSWIHDFPKKKSKSLNVLTQITHIDKNSIENVSSVDRKLYFDHIKSLIKMDRLDILVSLIDEYNENAASLGEYQKRTDIQILRSASIIGVTTTGAALNQDLLRNLADVIICEEAGEIFESHLLANLNKDLKHLILIGDHLQLRPKPEVFFLSRDAKSGYDLDVSTFERLVREKVVPFETLSIQRRMRPSISQLIRNTLYPNLQDHIKTTEFPLVLGMQSNLFFFSHENLESGKSGKSMETSFHNKFEAELISEFVRYLMLQGYVNSNENSKRLCILTPYLGQLREIRKLLQRLGNINVEIGEMDQEDLDSIDSEDNIVKKNINISSTKKAIECVRVATCDNFQGEESDIIILSLVRCNNQGKIGFLAINNRVNVALSRARHGFYIFGNASLLRQKSTMWEDVIKMLEKENNVGRCLKLCCKNHPLTENLIFKASDFNTNARDGGCSEPCTFRLGCGHVCPRFCHPDDEFHKLIRCKQKCERICNANLHPCNLTCAEKCKPCSILINESRELKCGHRLENLTCAEYHKEIGEIECPIYMPYVCKSCNRSIDGVTCSQLSKGNVKCNRKCNEKLSCGHECNELCKNPHGHSSELPCKQKCLRPLLNCGHLCESDCHSNTKCPPCQSSCEVRCSHSTCNLKCSKACSICVGKECDWKCEHRSCNLRCGVPCERPPCSEPCLKLLSCKHPCPSICGEDCPDPSFGCKHCAKEKYLSSVVDLILNTTMKDCNERLIFLSCKHAFTVETLDGIFEIDRFYNKDELNHYSSPIYPFPDVKPSYRCPFCKLSITNIQRYSRILKRCLHVRSYRLFQQEVQRDGFEIMNRSEEIFQSKNSDKKKINNINREIKNFLKKEDPLNKLWEIGYLNGTGEVVRPIIDVTWKLNAWIYQSKIQFLLDLKNINGSLTMCKKVFNIACEIPTPQLIHSSLVAQADILRKYYHRDGSEKVWGDVKHKLEDLLSEAKLIPGNVLWSKYLQSAYDYIGHIQDAHEKHGKITDEELKAIVQALVPGEGRTDVGWNGQGHFFECPNGHTYFISDCGGAMEVSRCNVCQEEIGGRQHQTIASNKRSERIRDLMRNV